MAKKRVQFLSPFFTSQAWFSTILGFLGVKNDPYFGGVGCAQGGQKWPFLGSFLTPFLTPFFEGPGQKRSKTPIIGLMSGSGPPKTVKKGCQKWGQNVVKLGVCT